MTADSDRLDLERYKIILKEGKTASYGEHFEWFDVFEAEDILKLIAEVEKLREQLAEANQGYDEAMAQIQTLYLGGKQ